MLQNVCNEKVDQILFIEQFGHQARLEIHQDPENNELHLFMGGSLNRFQQKKMI
jgi:hypothetical protein